MTSLILVFSGADTANYLVAGVPAAARAAREIALASRQIETIATLTIAVPGGWSPSAYCEAELRRLAPECTWAIADARLLASLSDTLYLCGESLPSAPLIAAAVKYPSASSPGTGPRPMDVMTMDQRAGITALKKAGAAILLATGKPSDGIVSRTFNRPISRAVSRGLLRLPGVMPFHATLGTAVLGLAMAASLLFGGETGLVLGALLFQAASIFDGVDGEIARATFRTSAGGAMLDSVIDALTNLAFIAGLTVNLWLQNRGEAAAAGAFGLAMLAIGLSLIGQRSRSRGGPFTFDVVKDHFRARPSPLMQFLTWITMRDFFAAAAAAMILVGFAPQALIIFSVAAAGWLAVTLSVLWRTRGGISRTMPS